MNSITNDVPSVIKSCRVSAESDRVCPTNNYYVYALLAPGRTHEVFYIGKGRGYRANQHFYPSEKGKNPHKDAVIAKYPDCYIEKIAENLSEEQALALEIHLIAKAPEGCLTNMTLGGEGTSGRLHTDEARAKMSKTRKGRKCKPRTDEWRTKMSKAQKGKTASDEARANMSKAQKGRTHTDETKANMSKAQKGKKRKPLTDEARANMSKAQKGKKRKPLTDETRAKISKAHKGKKCKPLTDETRAKISKAHKGKKCKPLTDEAKAKMSKAKKGLHCGENNPSAKLTWSMVDEIREKLAEGGKSVFIAREYAVSPRAIRDIKCNEAWVR